MRVIFILFSLLIGIYTNCNAQEKTHINLKQNINTLLDNWHVAASEANFENYFNAMDSNATFVGTDASEVWSKEEFAKFSKPHFKKGKAWSFTSLKRNIYIHSSKKIAWFDEVLDTWMGVCRGSGVVEKVNKQWKIKHYVLSTTVPNEDIAPIIKIKQKRDSLFIYKLRN